MDSDFKQWVASIGYNQKQVAKAGELIGMKEGHASIRNRGEKSTTLMERLAMSAVAAGLPAWEPSKQVEIEAYGKVIEVMKEAVADLQSTSRPPASSGRHIPAE